MQTCTTDSIRFAGMWSIEHAYPCIPKHVNDYRVYTHIHFYMDMSMIMFCIYIYTHMRVRNSRCNSTYIPTSVHVKGNSMLWPFLLEPQRWPQQVQ